MRIIATIIWALVVFALPYATCAFISWDITPFPEMDEPIRALVAFLWFFLLLPSLLILAHILGD